MASYILRRVLQAIPILIGISVIAFLIVNLAPGSPVDRFRSGRVSPQTIANLRRTSTCGTGAMTAARGR